MKLEERKRKGGEKKYQGIRNAKKGERKREGEEWGPAEKGGGYLSGFVLHEAIRL